MHMADALISPAVGGAAWAATAGLIGYSSRKVRRDLDDQRIPLMGVMGAFVFAAQMVNFTIPATGSSGHLGGGLILAILLGPHAGFLTLASVLMIQALFFADGGLLALGCNIFNLGFFPCFVAYPLIYRKTGGKHRGRWSIITASLAAAIVSLQLGSLGVVLQTRLSGISELPLGTFLLFMQPIHLAIGVIEGLATASVLLFVLKARPEILRVQDPGRDDRPVPLRGLAAVFIAAAVTLGAGAAWLASKHPDGLEWSVTRTSGHEELEEGDDIIRRSAKDIQSNTAIFPEYGFKSQEVQGPPGGRLPSGLSSDNVATALSGLIGGLLTLLFAGGAGFFLKRRRSGP